MDRALLRLVRHGVTLACLGPPVLLLACAAPWLLTRFGVAAGYPYALLALTAIALYLAYSRYEDPARYPLDRLPPTCGVPPLPRVPTVSVLMAVRDDAAGVGPVVRALAAADHPAVEIIIVDAGSVDGTAQVLDRLATELPVTVLRVPRDAGRRRALLHAAEHATGDLLAFVGDRCLLAPDAVRRCVDALVQDARLGAVCGHTRARNATRSPLTRGYDACAESRFRVGVAAAAAFGGVTDLPGGLAVFRRDAIYPYLPAWSAARPLAALVLGQRWFGRRLAARYAGSPFAVEHAYPARPWRVGYVRSARVYATAPSSPYPLLTQWLRHTAAVVRAAPFTARFAWRLGPAPATAYYARLLAVLLAPLAAGWHLAWEPAHGRWISAALYLGAAALCGTGYAIAAAIEAPRAGDWAYRPVASVLSALLLPLLPAYSMLSRVSAARRRVWGV